MKLRGLIKGMSMDLEIDTITVYHKGEQYKLPALLDVGRFVRDVCAAEFERIEAMQKEAAGQ